MAVEVAVLKGGDVRRRRRVSAHDIHLVEILTVALMLPYP